MYVVVWLFVWSVFACCSWECIAYPAQHYVSGNAAAHYAPTGAPQVQRLHAYDETIVVWWSYVSGGVRGG